MSRTRSTARSLAAALALLALIATGCEPAAQRQAFYVGEKDPADFTLSATAPEVFDFEVPATQQGPFDLALELTYFDNQLQGWTDLPLKYALSRPDGSTEENAFTLKLKDNKGEWRGQLKENQTDRVFEQDIKTGLALTAGPHALKLYGNSQDSAKPILGIVHVALKVYGK